MSSLRRLSYVAFFVACAHLVFGAIVRITGSGMGCGHHWPK
jgi:heme A synthase